MKMDDLKTRIFLDSGDAGETKEILRILGFLDGQTTNPTLVMKNSEVRKRIERGEKFSAEEIIEFYRTVVQEICGLINTGRLRIHRGVCRRVIHG